MYLFIIIFIIFLLFKVLDNQIIFANTLKDFHC
jgi:hypothetical protein